MTTTTCGAFKEGLAEGDCGVKVMGGKDGHPFPVERGTYDESSELLENALRQAKLGDGEKLDALKRLKSLS